MSTIELIGLGAEIPPSELDPALALIDVTDRVIDGIPQDIWEGMASGARLMDTNGDRIMPLVLEVTGVTERGTLRPDASDLLQTVEEMGVSAVREAVIDAYPALQPPLNTAHSERWGWRTQSPSEPGAVLPSLLRNSANAIRSAGIQIERRAA